MSENSSKNGFLSLAKYEDQTELFKRYSDMVSHPLAQDILKKPSIFLLGKAAGLRKAMYEQAAEFLRKQNNADKTRKEVVIRQIEVMRKAAEAYRAAGMRDYEFARGELEGKMLIEHVFAILDGKFLFTDEELKG